MIIFTDGACKTSDKTGGWAFIVTENDKQLHSAFFYEDDTTNNRMEIMSIIKALEWCKKNNISNVEIVSDSMYVIGTMSQNWKRNKNHDLWEILDKLVNKMSINWQHTKGHSGNKWNEKCDALAVAASNYSK